MNKTMCILIIGFFGFGCKTKIPIFENESINMKSWSIGDKHSGGATFTLFHLFNDTLQRHYFLSYTTLTNFIERTYNYHISSVNFHKDSVDINKLNKISKQNSGEYLFVKRNRKGKYLIKSEWYEEKNCTLKIKANSMPYHNLHSENFHINSAALKARQFVNGEINSELKFSSCKHKSILESNYDRKLLGIGDSLKYFEFVFDFDTLTYIINGYADKMLNIKTKYLSELSNNGVKSWIDTSYTVEIIRERNELKPAFINPVSIKIEIGSQILTSDFSSINQTIRSMKWHAWVGFSTCQLKNSDSLIDVGRKTPEMGIVKIIIL
jgi:hypothetical protein